MNIRAIALGTVIGFAIAMMPSCGGTKCSAANCSGCCDSKGVCQKDPNNKLNTTCGTQGNACVDCTASQKTCNASTFTCGTGTGTGGGTGGGTGTCDGCKLPNTGSCVSLANTSVLNCGANGATCASCGSGQLCNNGVCQTQDAGPSVGNIGDSCNADSDCNKVTKGFCKKVTIPGGMAYQQGYCTRRCTAQTDCGAGGHCAYWMGIFGELENICYKDCAGGGCRTGYDCQDISISSSKQYPSCVPVQADGGVDLYDAGPGATGAAGKACTVDGDCGPNPYFSCIPQVMADGGLSGFPGGQCTGDCSLNWVDDNWCGTNGVCLPYLIGQDSRGGLVGWLCNQQCDPSSADAGCRSSYVCEPFNGSATFGTCSPDCRTAPAGFCGSASCNSTTGVCG